jgi:hypothetical protein
MKTIKKFYISTLSFILILITLGTVTIVWAQFALINNVTGLDLSASTGDELELSLDGINYNNKLPDDLVRELFREVNLYDVTTMDGINFQTGGLRGVDEAVPNEHYLSFDLWFRTSRPERYIYLFNNLTNTASFDTNELGTYVLSRGVPWIAKYTFLNGPEPTDIVQQGTLGVYYAKNSVRMSFIEQIDEHNENDQRSEEELIRFIFDPSEDPTRGFGKIYGAFSYYFQHTLSYVSLPKEFPVTSYRLSRMDPNNPYQALDNESLIASLQITNEVDQRGRTYYSGKVRINIWIEGWDADAFDAITDDIMRIQLQFKAANKAEN